MKRTLLILIAFILLFNTVSAQEESDSLVLGADRKTVLQYSLAAYTLTSFYVEYQWWWEGNYQKFRYENDGFLDNYSLGVDKAGHFYTSYFYFQTLYEFMEWGGFDKTTCMITSIAVPALYAISIELNDGFTFYSFSGYDLTANFLGIGYGALQRQYPILDHFKFKWSYYPSGKIPLDGKFSISDDYDGHLYWLSMDIHGILPASMKGYWPKFLNVSVGYGAINVSHRDGLITSHGPKMQKFAVSLDYNLGSIDVEDGLLNVFRNIADYFHYPAPGVKMSPGRTPEFKPLLVN